MFCCGIDIAKRNHKASVIDAEGKPLLDSITIANTQEGCEKLFSLFERLKIDKEADIIGMEAAGHYWLSVHEHLAERGYNVQVINPIQSDAFRKMNIRQTKNDSKDSFIIAQVMRFGQYSEATLSDENTAAMRQLTRFRMALVDNSGDCKRRIIALLDQVFPECADLFSDTFGTTSKELLLNYPKPDDMLAVSTRKLTVFLSKASHGRFGEEKAKEIRAAAADSFGVGFAMNAFAFQTRQLIEQLMFTETQIEALDEQISHLLQQVNQVITTIPGIGDTLGAIIISEIGDIDRFDTPNKLVAFAGLDVWVMQSGEFTGTKQGISKRGSLYLRRTI